MRKQILIIVTLVAVFVASFVILYKQFSNETKAMTRTVYTADTVIKQTITLDELPEFSKNNPGEHVFFLTDCGTDSTYIIDSILTPLSVEQAERPTPDIIAIDLAASSNITVTRLKNVFGVDTYPAFIKASFDSSKNTLANTGSITHGNKKPMTVKNLKAWFFNNQLWKGPYVE